MLFIDTTTTKLSTLSLHDALPILFDHDVRRYVDFLERMGEENSIEPKTVQGLADRVHQFLERKQPGEVDIKEVDRKSTRLNSSHGYISYAVFCLKNKNIKCHDGHG